MKFSASIKNRPLHRSSASACALNAFRTLAVLSDEFAGMTIGDMFRGKAWPAPLPEISGPEGKGRLGALGLQFRQVNPRDGRVEMMVQMPVMIEPDQIKHAPRPHVPRALLHIANRPVVMNVLQG